MDAEKSDWLLENLLLGFQIYCGEVYELTQPLLTPFPQLQKSFQRLLIAFLSRTQQVLVDPRRNLTRMLLLNKLLIGTILQIHKSKKPHNLLGILHKLLALLREGKQLQSCSLDASLDIALFYQVDHFQAFQ